MISYEQYCESISYDDKVIGKPSENDTKSYLMRFPFYTYHYLKYISFVTNRPMSNIILEIVDNYVESRKNL